MEGVTLVKAGSLDGAAADIEVKVEFFTKNRTSFTKAIEGAQQMQTMVSVGAELMRRLTAGSERKDNLSISADIYGLNISVELSWWPYHIAANIPTKSGYIVITEVQREPYGFVVIS